MTARRAVTWWLGAALLPTVVCGFAVRPAAATVTPTGGYDQYGLTALAAGVRTNGDVGQAGGLVNLGSGSAYVAARLDSSPSAQVRAAPYEPGALVRTFAGQANATTGTETVVVPDAEAGYPGHGQGHLESVPAQAVGPLSTDQGAASAEAKALSANGSATGAWLQIAGAVQASGAASQVTMSVNPTNGLASASATATVGRLAVVGVLELRDVVGRALVTATGAHHVAAATLTVGGATINGQDVAFDETGVHAVGTSLLPGQSLQDATTQANAALTSAGIAVHLVNSVQSTTDRTAAADTGGLVVSLITPAAAGGVAANALTLRIGAVSVTETDALATPALTLPALGKAQPQRSRPSGQVVTSVTTPGTPATVDDAETPDDQAGPQVAPLLLPATRSLAFAHHRISSVAALAAFATWQFLTLGMATLYALVDRYRRLAA